MKTRDGSMKLELLVAIVHINAVCQSFADDISHLLPNVHQKPPDTFFLRAGSGERRIKNTEGQDRGWKLEVSIDSTRPHVSSNARQQILNRPFVQAVRLNDVQECKRAHDSERAKESDFRIHTMTSCTASRFAGQLIHEVRMQAAAKSRILRSVDSSLFIIGPIPMYEDKNVCSH